MDFMKVLRSLEEFLYEVMTWLVFYPKTFWISLTRPLATMRYSDEQQVLPSEEQYVATVNPVLFLMLSLFLVHAVELAMHRSTESDQPLPVFMQSDTNLLLVRSIFFGIFPLFYAMTLLARRRTPIDRNTLRGPFLAQCHPAAVFATAVGLATTARLIPDARTHWVAGAMVVLSTAWYLSVQMRSLAEQLSIRRVFALGLALAAFLAATLLFVIAAVALVGL